MSARERAPLADPVRASHVQSLACEQCATTVLVRKASLAQTAVQWPEGAGRCTEFATAKECGTAMVATCPQLRSSIEQAVRKGELAVVDL
ncbi:hypothetical protein [Streptomyces sp. NPDC055681]